MIILSKANLVDEGIDCDVISADLMRTYKMKFFTVNNQRKGSLNEVCKTLIRFHNSIQQVF